MGINLGTNHVIEKGVCPGFTSQLPEPAFWSAFVLNKIPKIEATCHLRYTYVCMSVSKFPPGSRVSAVCFTGYCTNLRCKSIVANGIYRVRRFLIGTVMQRGKYRLEARVRISIGVVAY